MGCDDPPLPDNALDRVQLSLIARLRDVGRDVDVAAMIVEDGLSSGLKRYARV